MRLIDIFSKLVSFAPKRFLKKDNFSGVSEKSDLNLVDDGMDDLRVTATGQEICNASDYLGIYHEGRHF
jgi:hypothetical protein